MGRFSRRSIPLEVIQAAMDGDSDALQAVCDHYKGYIRYLSTQCVSDCYGNCSFLVDEDMCCRLEAKLMYSIVTGFRILPE